MIEYYENAETAPFRRYQRFNSILANKMQTGDNLGDISKRIDRALAYNNKQDAESVRRELSNLRLSVHYTANEVNLEALALAVMVKSINGRVCDDITIEGLNNTLDELNNLGLSISDIRNKTREVKKKSNLIYTFISKTFSRRKT